VSTIVKSLSSILVVLISCIFISPVFAKEHLSLHFNEHPNHHSNHHKEYRDHHGKDCRWVSGFWKHGKWHPAKKECWHR